MVERVEYDLMRSASVGEEYVFDPTTDTVMRFVGEPELDYLRYQHHESGKMTMMRVGHQVLSHLVDELGLPETQRVYVTPSELDHIAELDSRTIQSELDEL